MASSLAKPVIGAGIVGGGFMAGVHAHAARVAGAQLLGITSSSPERTALAATSLHAEAYNSLAALLDDERIDIVHVCTPNALHGEQAREVLAAGKSVVCERPLALSSSDANGLAALAHSQGRVATVPFVYRYHPLVREARSRARSELTQLTHTQPVFHGPVVRPTCLGEDSP